MAFDHNAKMNADLITIVREAIGEHDEDAALRLDMIEAETDALELMSTLIRAMRDEAATDEAQRKLAAHYRTRSEATTRRVCRIRDAIGLVAEATGLEKIQRPEGTVYRRQNPPRVIVTDLAALEAFRPELVKSEIKPKLKEIGDALKGGESVEGATLSNAAPGWGVR